MAHTPTVHLKDSISTKLLSVVFSLYLIVAIAVTFIHMIAEYYNTKDGIIKDLGVFEKTFEHALSTEVWNVDEYALGSILKGMVEVPIIVGVRVEDMKGDEILSNGVVLGLKDTPILTNIDGSQETAPKDLIFSELIEHHFTLVFVTEDEKRFEVGKGVLYSSTAIVLRKVQYGFLFIIVNSVIKTAALWVIFLLIGRILLNRPLSILTSATAELSLDNLENLKIDVQTSGRNELKVLEETFNTMVKKLLLARERYTSLRVFFSRIADFKDTSRMFHAMFHEFCQHIALTKATLFFASPDGLSTKHPTNTSEGLFLSKEPTPDFLQQIFQSKEDEITIHNFVLEDNPILKFYASEANPPKAGSHFVYVRIPSLDEQIICLYRNAEQEIFDSSDIEYIKSMLNEIKVADLNIKAIRENARMEGELHIASAVQHALLPKALPQVRNLELACFFQSATETGGDWYGFATKIDNALFILIGDVTGHGTPAALVAATASATCKTLEEMYYINKDVPSPSEFLRHLNRAVFEAGAPNFLMTFFVARIDLDTGQMVFSNAGHNFPILLQADGTVKHALNANYRLGSAIGWDFSENSLQLEVGDLLFLYTDGLIENTNKSGEMWGERKLVRFLKNNRELHTQALVQDLVKDVYNFYNGCALDDDFTIVACKVIAPFK